MQHGLPLKMRMLTYRGWRFVILDDTDFGWEELRSRAVITNSQGYGLEAEHVHKALEILNKRIVFK